MFEISGKPFQLSLCIINAYALSVAGCAFEFNDTVNESKECIVRSATDVYAGANVCASLSYDYVAGFDALSVGFLNAQTLSIGITAVLCRANAFFVSKKLQAES